MYGRCKIKVEKLITRKDTWFPSGDGATNFYHPNQVTELKKKLKNK